MTSDVSKTSHSTLEKKRKEVKRSIRKIRERNKIGVRKKEGKREGGRVRARILYL